MKDFKKDKEVIAFIITVVIVIVFEASLTYKLYKENEQFQIYEESQMAVGTVAVFAGVVVDFKMSTISTLVYIASKISGFAV